MRSLRPNHSTIAAYAALFIALGGTSYAAVTVSGKNVKDNSLTTKDIKNKSLLKKDFKSGQLPAGARGPAGPAGAKGDTGAPGTPGQSATKLWALVKSDGTLVRGSHVLQSFKYGGGNGSYELAFDQDVSNCTYVANKALETAGRGNSAPAGEIGVRPLSTSAQGVSITTRDSAGALADSAYTIAVYC
jgi:hypothetical protein